MFFWNACNTAAKIALARRLTQVVGAVRKVRGASGPLRVTRHGVRFELDLTEGIDFCIYLLGMFEPNTVRSLRRLVRPGMTVLDIGANVGAHTLHLARMVGPTGQVIAFEPTDYAFGKLRRNLALNPGLARRVVPVQAYLTDQIEPEQQAGFYASWRLVQQSGQHPKHLGSLVSAAGAREYTLDEYAATKGLRSVDVIKLDVDGFECKVIRGGRSTIGEHHPAIVTEVCPYVLEEHGDSAAILLDLLEAHGYWFHKDASLAPFTDRQKDLIGRIPPDGGINVVALASRLDR